MEEKTVRCPVCNSLPNLKKEVFQIFGGRIRIEDDEFYKCTNCGEEFATSEQVRALEKKVREKYFFKRQIISTGRSLAITLPKDFLEFYHLEPGRAVKIIPQGKKEAKLVF